MCRGLLRQLVPTLSDEDSSPSETTTQKKLFISFKVYTVNEIPTSNTLGDMNGKSFHVCNQYPVMH